jgi:hypothetical protein
MDFFFFFLFFEEGMELLFIDVKTLGSQVCLIYNMVIINNKFSINKQQSQHGLVVKYFVHLLKVTGSSL